MRISESSPFVRRQARPGWVAINFGELWQYRELLVFQAVRDIKVLGGFLRGVTATCFVL